MGGTGESQHRQDSLEFLMQQVLFAAHREGDKLEEALTLDDVIPIVSD